MYVIILVYFQYITVIFLFVVFNVISYVVLVYNCSVLCNVFICFMWTPGRVAAACAIANSDPNELNCYMIYHKKLNKGPNHKPLY